MTEEKLKKALEIEQKISTYKKFLKAFDSPYVNVIRANDYDGDREKSQIILLCSEPELESTIIKYFADKVEQLEKEFEELN